MTGVKESQFLFTEGGELNKRGAALIRHAQSQSIGFSELWESTWGGPGGGGKEEIFGGNSVFAVNPLVKSRVRTRLIGLSEKNTAKKEVLFAMCTQEEHITAKELKNGKHKREERERV